MASSFGAGAGADMLEEILTRKFREAVANQEMAQRQQQIQQEQQRITQQGAYQNESLRSLEDERAAMGAFREQQTKASQADLAAKAQAKQDEDTANAQALADPNLPENIKQFLRLRKAVPGGAVPSELFKPPEQPEEVRRVNPRTGKMETLGTAPKGTHFVQEPVPRQPAQIGIVAVQTVDEQGNPVTRFVEKKAGDSYVKPASATTATRVGSAETVNEVGNDMIRKMSDPAIRAQLGPAMGRYNSLKDFIGNPPPEFAELAGQIESYSLANMGVHGMRSAQGAAMIRDMLDKPQTPESLAAKIRGLNDFSTRYVQINKPKAPGATAPAGGAAAPPPAAKKLSPAELLKKYGG